MVAPTEPTRCDPISTQSARKGYGVFASPTPVTEAPYSRNRSARWVKSPSELAITN